MPGSLIGSWLVVCPDGHVDQVDQVTVNHDCEHCGLQSVNQGAAKVKCPQCGLIELVEGVTASHVCRNGHECKLP